MTMGLYASKCRTAAVSTHPAAQDDSPIATSSCSTSGFPKWSLMSRSPTRSVRGGQLLNGRRKEQGKQGNAWGLREECMVSLLFETGARVSEIITLTLDDWHSRG